MSHATAAKPTGVLSPADVERLLTLVRAQGYTTVGPTVRDGAIVYREIDGIAALPQGWGDEQDGGRYRLVRRDDGALFGYAVGPDSCKKYLYPSRRVLWEARKDGDEISFSTPAAPPPRYAFLGTRACELAAVAVQERVFSRGAFTESDYTARQQAAAFIAVDCGTPSGTCFCASMDTGPDVREGADLVLTELLGEGGHVFVARADTARGSEWLRALDVPAATAEQQEAAAAVTREASARMGRRMDTAGLPQLLRETMEHPAWNDVADRCLACANCTLACPTCFCSTVEEVADLDGRTARHERVWDSCFSEDFSYIHGGSVRESTRSRYRQWLTHKLGTWHDQFGTSGCVGCGRCITWCPVGIDLTAEVRRLRGNPPGGEAHG